MTQKHSSARPISPCPIHRASVIRDEWVRFCLFLAFLAFATFAHAQVTLPTAVDLALTHSPRLRAAQADVEKARASLQQAHDVYYPVVTVETGAGGDEFGYSANPGSAFTFNAQSLVFNFSQKDYIRAGRFGLNAATLALQDARLAVIEDTALSFLSLQHDQQRQGVLRQENDFAQRLVAIVQDRVSAGRDTTIDLTTARLTAAQLNLAFLRAQDDTATDRDHLALALGMRPTPSLTADGPIPPPTVIPAPQPGIDTTINPTVAAAYATALAKEEISRGDHRYLLRPQFTFGAQYNRYDTLTSSFGTIQGIHGSPISPNEGAVGIQLSIPLFDRVHKAKADESAADAVHARAEADDAQRTALEGQLKLRHSIDVLQAQSTVAQLEQQLAQQQLDALTLQLDTASAGPNGPALSPKDEQTSRIAERQKFLALVDADYLLQEAQIRLLRQTGQLEAWLRQSLQATPVSASRP
jgi:outer membrane protein TolC